MMTKANMERRQFLKVFALTTAYSSWRNADWIGTVLAEVKPLSRPTVGIFRLRITDYPALLNDFGSVRIGTSRLVSDLPKGLFYPVLITRAPGNQFYALSSECTHEGCTVSTYNRTIGASTCPCHQSRFAIDGRRISGPASFPLLRYQASYDGASTLTVEIPDWPHEVVGSVVAGGPTPNPRFRLAFLAFADLEFEVLFRPSLDQAWQRVSFAVTPEGSANQTVFNGIDDFVSLYVDRATEAGFYAVAIRIRPV